MFNNLITSVCKIDSKLFELTSLTAYCKYDIQGYNNNPSIIHGLKFHPFETHITILFIA